MIAQLQKVFSRVRSKQREAERDQFQTYWEIVARVAHGESLDEGALVDCALAAGRHAESLAADVELYLRRERLARELAEAPRKLREAEKLARLIESKTAELNAIQQKLGTEIAGIYESKKILETEAAVGQHATELINSAPNPAHRAALDELGRKRRELHESRAPLIETARGNGPGSMRGALTGIESQLDEWSHRRDPDAREHVRKLEEYAGAYRERLKALEQQIANLDEKLAAADAESEALRIQMMKP